MLKSLKLNRVGPVPDLSADFGERLNILTGDNGLGKSFLLDLCFWALTGTWPGGRTAIPEPSKKKSPPTITYHLDGLPGERKPKTGHYDFHSQTWTERQAGRPASNLVVYAAVDGSYAVWDPARNYRRDPATGVKEADERPRAYQFTADSLANGLKDGDRVLCNGLVQDWVDWYYRKSSAPAKSPFTYLENVVSLLSHPDEPMSCGEPKRVFVDQTRSFPVLSMPYGDVAYPHWSAGVRRIISLAYLIVWACSEHKEASRLRNEKPADRLILIVDEVEAHLHPKWQRTILPALLGVAGKLQSYIDLQILSATHSPLVLASLEPHFRADTDRLFWFDMNGKTASFSDYPWVPHGDVVGWLTSDIFGLSQARSREAEDAIEAAEAFMRDDRESLPKGLKTKQAIHQALVRSLPGIDPFWPRWIVETRQDAGVKK
jgi:hypothetical protein